MRIVVLDGYTENPGDLSWEKLEEMGDLTVYDRTNGREAAARLQGADIAVTNKTPITSEVMDACPDLRYITVLATGYNIVDTACASRKGIPVSNVPAYGTASVAQYSIAMLLEICHHIGHHSRTVSEGRWCRSEDFCYWDYPLLELDGKTIGIVGFGRIGQAEGRIAKALGMKVLAYDPNPNAAGSEIATYVPLEELYARSDVISLHCNLTEQNREMINRDSISRMKNGVILLNNARGQLIREADLADALNSGRVYAAGLDVVGTEPILQDNPLLHAKNCLITPHISWAALECRERIMESTAANIRSFLEGNPIHVVNMDI